ncbi:intracellular protein transport protein-like protein [Rhizodiscina lignyota]|uniref:Intracellular protein transport protein-like protein n=1 Tax=Rhizodiscina lignyota TaxID=1504668 RepID=A0A9P4IGG2_9PEZI|nr:intracellular protein transport protein-like protein [Rhizodiscina lignyota]
MLKRLETPAKQTATDTISTLSSRLSSATLLEDRRAAILGLRSFAKEYPASVASGSLRDLISSLNKDADDVDTIKVVLETLLMLFNPDERSPEASEDIALWLADEFTQRQDNITILLDLLEAQEFYLRLYSLQLIAAITSLRPQRTQECILSAPLGTTRLVATLDDRRDAIRNAGLLLLIDLTQTSTELQKLVAFENAFERIFKLIELEGSLSQGGIVVQDCLSLLANLVRYNNSNQSLFRETGCVVRLSQLLPGGQTRQSTEDDDWTNPQKDKNLWGLLAILRLFLAKGSPSTQLNQTAFQKHGLIQLILNLAFTSTTALPIRAEALYTCADMIRGNARLQEGFAQLQVVPLSSQSQPKQANGQPLANGAPKTYVIDALLDLTLSESSPSAFEARFAACECVKAYCHNHQQIKVHFLNRAIDGHKAAGEDETANVLTILIRGQLNSPSTDAYRYWFAAVIVLYLISEDQEAKALAMKLVEGDAESGEEVVTCIQAISGNLVAGIQRGDDERITTGYLMLLCGWLFESPDAVNDFLGEGSSLQVLMQTASKTNAELVITRGICAVLVGIVYEFSTKDSPIPRRKLQPILMSSLGRERYLDALAQLRRHPLVRDFEVLTQGSLGGDPGAQPEVTFDSTFVDFFKDNFSRLSRAIDRDPGLEVNLSQDGIDRDLVDSLRSQIEDKTQALQKAETEMISMERKLNQEETDHRRAQETSATEIARIKQINEALQKNHESNTQEIEEAHKSELAGMESQFRQQYQALQAQLQQVQRQASEDMAKSRDQHTRELESMKKARSEAEEKYSSAQHSAEAMSRTVADLRGQFDITKAELATAQQQVASLEAKVRERDEKITGLLDMAQRTKSATEKIRTEIGGFQKKMEEAQKVAKEKDGKLKEVEGKIKTLEEEKEAAETEKDDLLMVLADLEDKRTKDKKRLKELGEETSDMEDADGDGEEEGEDEEEGEGEEAEDDVD